jgi:recombinational DNA repair ATPase RecF
MRKVTLKNIRNIRSLEFEIPQPGVWMLASANGAGKTSLLACLLRIGKPNAFQTAFPRGYGNIDQNTNANIKYSMGEEEVIYSYGGHRWAPTPRTAKVLQKKWATRQSNFLARMLNELLRQQMI